VSDTVALELVGVRSGANAVTSKFGADDLALSFELAGTGIATNVISTYDDVLVGEADDESVLWCAVLVLGLADELCWPC
jgi:hypothetical protein